MKSTWFGNRARYEIARLIAEADYASQYRETFRAFLEAAAYSLRQGVHLLTHGRLCEQIEERVIRAQRAVQKPERLAEAFAVLVDALERSAEDVLGKLMTELAVNDKNWKGQCFTPTEVSRCVAEIALAGAAPGERPLTLLEPACGGGSMIIAASQVLRERGFSRADYLWTAVDVDWRCFAMTFIQCTLLDIPAGALHGNSLTLETFDAAWTPAALPLVALAATAEFPPTQPDAALEVPSIPQKSAEFRNPALVPSATPRDNCNRNV